MNTAKDEFRDRLKKIISKKFDTAMIYPLSQFEMAFGHLWGHNKSEDALTEDELMNRSKWFQCRNNILNIGNQQKRNANTELEMHDVSLKRYTVEFAPVNVIKE